MYFTCHVFKSKPTGLLKDKKDRKKTGKRQEKVPTLFLMYSHHSRTHAHTTIIYYYIFSYIDHLTVCLARRSIGAWD